MRLNPKYILCALVLGATCSDPEDSGESDTPGAYIRNGGSQSDSISTILAQALVVEVVPPSGPREDIVVRFDAVPSTTAATVTVAPLAELDAFVASAIVPADSRGRAIVRVRLGGRTGVAQIKVTVPEFGYEIFVPFTVLPGAAADLLPLPQDTLVEIGATFPSRSTVIDRLGNLRTDPVSLASPSANVAIAGNQVTATAAGRGTVTVASGTLQREMRIHVGLTPGISGLTLNKLVHFDPDGAVILAVDITPRDRGTADWSPDGGLLVADDPAQGPMRLIAPGGQTRLLGEGLPNWGIYPEFSRDGEWIYYSRADEGWHIRRIHPDGTGDMAVPGIPANHAAPSLSPDGRFMAVVNLIPDRVEVFEFATNTLREIAAAAHTPAWSPDGSRIAFVNSSTGQLELINPDGSNRRVISAQNRGFALGIDWTADGLMVVGLDQLSGKLVGINPVTLAEKEFAYPGIGAPAARLR